MAAEEEPSSMAEAEEEPPWPELLGSNNWDGLLDPLNLSLRRLILRCGDFCQATYDNSVSIYVSSRKEKELLKDVYSVYEEMKRRNCAIYADACELLIEAYCNGREPEKVFGIVSGMVRVGYSPKTFTFNIAIHALCRCGEVDKALEVLMMMHKDRKAKGIPFSRLIDELNGQGRSFEACGVYGLALKRGVVPKRKPR